MSQAFKNYDDAYECARTSADKINKDYGIEKAKEYGKTVFRVKILPGINHSFGHELMMERVTPGMPKCIVVKA